MSLTALNFFSLLQLCNYIAPAFAILIFETGAVECPYWTYCIEGSLRDDYVTGKIVIEYAGESGTPYYQWEKKQAPLEGEALKRQLKKWVR